MRMYLISYELKSEIKDYSELYASIKSLGDWQHPIDSIWFVKTDLKADAIYKYLRVHTNDGDNLLVTRVNVSDIQGWLPRVFWDWINKNQEND